MFWHNGFRQHVKLYLICQSLCSDKCHKNHSGNTRVGINEYLMINGVIYVATNVRVCTCDYLVRMSFRCLGSRRGRILAGGAHILSSYPSRLRRPVWRPVWGIRQITRTCDQWLSWKIIPLGNWLVTGGYCTVLDGTAPLGGLTLTRISNRLLSGMILQGVLNKGVCLSPNSATQYSTWWTFQFFFNEWQAYSNVHQPLGKAWCVVG